MLRSAKVVALIMAGMFLVPTVAIAGGQEEVPDEVVIEYILWDSAQLPAYEEVAEAFMEQHPDITIEIDQMGWGDYWDDLTRRLAVGDAPDVWTNHVAFFLDFAERGQMMPLDDRIAESDVIDLDAFMPGLDELFVYDGNTYGLPKDWDTIAVLYNREHLAEAGIDEAELQDLTWNPDDGGSFQELAARLTVDENGVRGDEDGFDPNNIDRYGYGVDWDGVTWGQTQFSHFPHSLGWTFHDETGTEFYYDDQRLASTFEWFQDMISAGYKMPYEDAVDVNELFVAGETSLTTDGSWMIGWYVDGMDDNLGFAPLPAGPEGRNSMFNGLSDAVWAGTDHPEEAWKWVEFLASPEAQEIVGSHGIVFPAVQSGTDIALEVYEERGIDVTAYTDLAFDEDKNHLHPIVENATDIADILQDAYDRVFLTGDDPASVFQQANNEIDALFP